MTDNAMKEGPDAAHWRTLPEICMLLHMHHTGASDVLSDEHYQSGVDYLRERTRSWKAALNSRRWLAFDAAVFNLCAVTLAEADAYAEKFAPAEKVT